MSKYTKFRIMNIDWDTDGEEVDLPKELVIEMSQEYVLAYDDFDEAVSELLSDNYGWCVNGFCFEELDDPESRTVDTDITALPPPEGMSKADARFDDMKALDREIARALVRVEAAHQKTVISLTEAEAAIDDLKTATAEFKAQLAKAQAACAELDKIVAEMMK